MKLADFGQLDITFTNLPFNAILLWDMPKKEGAMMTCSIYKSEDGNGVVVLFCLDKDVQFIDEIRKYPYHSEVSAWCKKNKYENICITIR